jgi:hypothetical protein
MASWFMDTSSRIAVCGQPPVSTPVTRPLGSTASAIRNSASSRVKMSLVTTAISSSPHEMYSRVR